jgi:hypothetical protein
LSCTVAHLMQAFKTITANMKERQHTRCPVQVSPADYHTACLQELVADERCWSCQTSRHWHLTLMYILHNTLVMRKTAAWWFHTSCLSSTCWITWRQPMFILSGMQMKVTHFWTKSLPWM